MSQAAGNGGPRPGPGPEGPAQEPSTAEQAAQLADQAARIAEQAARIAELEDLRLRALADLDNARKRCAAQIRRAEEEARAAVARQWLPVLDSLDLALEHAAADPATIVDGVEAARAQALAVLAWLGLPRRRHRAGRIAPARHEALHTR